jgi:hypothetical protein
MVRVLKGLFVFYQSLDILIEQFLSSLHFKNRGKLCELGLEIDTNVLKSGDYWIHSGIKIRVQLLIFPNFGEIDTSLIPSNQFFEAIGFPCSHLD